MRANTTEVPSSKKKHHVPDLKGLMRHCDLNYLRFLQLLPAVREVSDWEFGVETVRGRPLSRVCLHVTERGPYTTTLRLEQQYDYPDWLPNPLITVRLYHDARMAEVLSCQQSPRIRGNYLYPNPRMFHPDEKTQLNILLGEWLEHCLRAGYAMDLPRF
ncbi:Protein of unknown function DUF1249 [gamma proteobacterium HdN1]|nr:Protein of unknown function DUF1249 [gamma proteobacterium HdN1]